MKEIQIQMLRLLDEISESVILLPILNLTLANLFQGGQARHDLQCVKGGLMAEDLMIQRQDHGSHMDPNTTLLQR